MRPKVRFSVASDPLAAGVGQTRGLTRTFLGACDEGQHRICVGQLGVFKDPAGPFSAVVFGRWAFHNQPARRTAHGRQLGAHFMRGWHKAQIHVEGLARLFSAATRG